MSKLNQTQTRVLVITGILSIILMTAGVAVAQGPGKGMGKGMGHGMGQGMGMRGHFHGEMGSGQGFRLERMAARLNLTDEQQEAIKVIQENSRDQGLQLRKEMMRLQNEMQGEMLKDNPSEKTVLTLNEKMGDTKTELKANRLKTRLAVREQLTPEQRDQMLMMGDNGRRGGRGCDGHHGRKFSGRSQGRFGMGNGHGWGMGQGDGTGPRSNIDCPVNNQ